jgi:secreted trypsin-like serine protease
MKIEFPLITLFFLSSVSAQVSRKLIYGGTEVTPNRYPYLASLYKRNAKTGDLTFVCTGSLIAPSVILTSAYCDTADDAGIDVAKLGLHDLTMTKKTPHESYDISSNSKDNESVIQPRNF